MQRYMSFVLFFALVPFCIGLTSPAAEVLYDQGLSTLITEDVQCNAGFCHSKNLSTTGKSSLEYRTVRENFVPWENLTGPIAFDMEELLPVTPSSAGKKSKSKRENTVPPAIPVTDTLSTRDTGKSQNTAKAESVDEIEGSGALETEIFTTTTAGHRSSSSESSTAVTSTNSAPVKLRDEIPVQDITETSTLQQAPVTNTAPASTLVSSESASVPGDLRGDVTSETSKSAVTGNVEIIDTPVVVQPILARTEPTGSRQVVALPYLPTEILHEPAKAVVFSQPARPEDRNLPQLNQEQPQLYERKCPSWDRQIHIKRTDDGLFSDQCAEFVELPVTDREPHSVTFDIPFPHDPRLLALCGDQKSTEGKGFTVQYWDCDTPFEPTQLPGESPKKPREAPASVSTDHRVLQLMSFFVDRGIYIAAFFENGRSQLYEVFLDKEVRVVKSHEVPVREATSLAVVQKSDREVYVAFSVNNPNRKDRTNMHEKISPIYRMHHNGLHLCGYAPVLHSVFVTGWTDVLGDVIFGFVTYPDKRSDKSTLVFYQVIQGGNGECRVEPKPGQPPIQSIDNAPLCGVRSFAPYYRHNEIYLIVTVDVSPGITNCPSDSVKKSFLLKAAGLDKSGLFETTRAVYFPGAGKFSKARVLEGWCSDKVLAYGVSAKPQLFSIGKDLAITPVSYQGVPNNFADVAVTHCGDHTMAKFSGAHFEPKALYSISCDPESCKQV